MIISRVYSKRNRWANSGYKEWRNAVLLRDKYECQKCGKFSRSLHVHHIRNFNSYKEGIINISNGISLCGKCHYKFHSKFGNYNNNAYQLSIFFSGNNG